MQSDTKIQLLMELASLRADLGIRHLQPPSERDAYKARLTARVHEIETQLVEG